MDLERQNTSTVSQKNKFSNSNYVCGWFLSGKNKKRGIKYKQLQYNKKRQTTI